ncbi:MAG: acetyl-CoA decarbonylase/synthase complex subunit delta [Candidatus Omnitrophica bacterium]|nr:acetyl-CoA decarbonylase/synthase complex subunit delta [Candidatus Omnitrophota bacterium]MCM8790428.1 acetyl-CoA decarbonylase/synthase complex subunit delta [Candidatus Omnitrophota bacterium]
MSIELIKEKCSAPINMVEIGGGGVGAAVRIGGQSCLPLLFEEGDCPNPPVVALEIADYQPDDWAESVRQAYGEAIKDPVAWAKACVGRFGAKILCVRLQGMHPDYGGRPADEAAEIVKAILAVTKVPLIVLGCGDDEIDNDSMPKVSQALKGHNCLLGTATQSNYKTLTATALADGHSLIAESPIDINIAKQVNILISDMGFDPKRIIMHPTTTSLGYGMEYVYSIMERGRLAAFIGDRMLAMPFVLFVGQEVWKTKEAKESVKTQGINWEIATAVSLVQAGADLLVMRHPDAAKAVERYIGIIMKGAKT